MKEEARLFNLGYDSGKMIFPLTRERESEFAGDIAPLLNFYAITDLSQSTSDDFVLGRLYQMVSDSSRKGVLDKINGNPNHKEIKKVATREINSSNCDLLD